jgi:FAD/FMN-containing dehydrogenase
MAEITLRAVPRPARTALAIVHFDELAAAAEATPALLELQPSAVELLDKLLLDLCRQHAAYRQHLTFVQGDSGLRAGGGVLRGERGRGARQAGRPAPPSGRARPARRGHAAAWTRLARPTPGPCARAGLTLLLGRRGDVKPAGFMEDVSVPVEHLPAYVRSVQRMMARARQAGRLLLRPCQRRLPAHPPPAQPSRAPRTSR